MASPAPDINLFIPAPKFCSPVADSESGATEQFCPPVANSVWHTPVADSESGTLNSFVCLWSTQSLAQLNSFVRLWLTQQSGATEQFCPPVANSELGTQYHFIKLVFER